MLKLIALKIYKDCAKHIYKCLKPDVYYYLCKDFYFNPQGDISYRDMQGTLLHSDFFNVPKRNEDETEYKNGILINISAIVGKNGDGKSSIIEVMLRLINNLSKQYKIYKTPLQYIDGLRAVLIYQLDDELYKIEESDNKGVRLIHYASLSKDSKEITILNKPIRLYRSNPILTFFYTWVSNYSHYAYNVYDFKKEWNVNPELISNEEQANKACWLYSIFNKNDGYLAPLAFHPYRYSGKIDINRERSLAEQRLTSLFINSTDSTNAFRNITENTAVAIKLTPLTYSKLHKRTLEDYLLSVRDQNDKLDWAYRKLVAAYRKPSDNETAIESWYDNSKEYVIDLLDELVGEKKLSNSNHQPKVSYTIFLHQMDVYIRENMPQIFAHSNYGRYSKGYSDIARYLHAIKSIDDNMQVGRMPIAWESYLDLAVQMVKYEPYQDYNVTQLARLCLIYKVAEHYGINPLIVCKPFEELTHIEKAQHYLIYKTISIFHTYPSYLECVETSKLPWDACREYTDEELNKLFIQLRTDKSNDSHVTRKLSQTIHYITNCKEHGEIYKYLSNQEDNPIFKRWSNQDEIVLGLDTLRKYYVTEKIKLSELPPPIYISEILYQRENSYIGMEMLSSGEKQMLNILGAIIYHLQNIDSTKKYKCVNIILEEIELYFHPEYQRQIVYRIIRQIKGEELLNIKAVNIIFVTHSPFILSDIPKRNVLFLRDGKPDNTMQENTFGANIHSLLKNGFFLPNIPIGEFAYHKINHLFARLNANDIKTEEIALLDQEITLVGEPYLREQLYKLFYSFPQVKIYYENQNN